MADARDAALADPLLGPPAAKVLQSMTVHWSGLTVFVEHPWVPMDNNRAERDVRLPVVGRKNFYGSGAEWSGQLAATMYSLLMTARLRQLNARTWLSATCKPVPTTAIKRRATAAHFCPGPWTPPGLLPCALSQRVNAP